MSKPESVVASKLSITAGMGTAAMAIGLVIVFFGYMDMTLWALGLGSSVIGLGALIALVCATGYLFGKR